MAGSKDESTRSPARQAGSRKPKAPRMLFAAFQKYHPFRALDWQWRRAEWLIAEGKPLSPDLDAPETLYVAEYLRQLNGRQDDRQMRKLLRRYGDLHIAHQLYRENHPTRWLIESRILAGLTDEQIAQADGLPAEAVGWFEKVFFHVRDRFAAEAWIAGAAFPKLTRHELTLQDQDQLLRWAGYFGGPLVLSVLAPYILNPGVDLSAISPEHRLLAPKVRRLLAVMTTQIQAPVGKRSEKPSDENEPLTVDQEKLLDQFAVQRRAILRRSKPAIKPSQLATVVSSETEAPLGCSASGGE